MIIFKIILLYIYILNIITVLDCLDYEKSDYITIPNSEKILRFNKYEFKSEKIQGKHIFKIKGDRFCDIFISDELKNNIDFIYTAEKGFAEIGETNMNTILSHAIKIYITVPNLKENSEHKTIELFMKTY